MARAAVLQSVVGRIDGPVGSGRGMTLGIGGRRKHGQLVWLGGEIYHAHLVFFFLVNDSSDTPLSRTSQWRERAPSDK